MPGDSAGLRAGERARPAGDRRHARHAGRFPRRPGARRSGRLRLPLRHRAGQQQRLADEDLRADLAAPEAQPRRAPARYVPRARHHRPPGRRPSRGLPVARPARSRCRRAPAARALPDRRRSAPQEPDLDLSTAPSSTTGEAFMKIVVGSDHAGFPMKAELLSFLKGLGHEVEDVGSYDPKPVDFPDIARKVAAAITSGGAERGLMVCGTGVAAVAAMGVVHTASANALDDIKKAGKIRIAIDLGVPPYGMTDDKMQATGSDVATAKALAKDWGLEFELVPTTGATRIPSLQTGKADLVISTLSITPERAKVIDFSKGYAVLRTVIAAPKSVNVKSLADLDGKTVGTVRGTTHDTQLTKEGPKGMKLVRYEDDATEGQAFLSGQVDIFSTAEMLVGQLDKKNPARQVEVKFVLDNFKLAIGVKKDEARLLEEVNRWVSANLRNGRLNELNKKYFASDLPDLILKQ